jgi:hypothetical protein
MGPRGRRGTPTPSSPSPVAPRALCRPPAPRAGATALLAAALLAAAASALPRRASASVLHGADLSNFQQEFACDNASVLIVR